MTEYGMAIVWQACTDAICTQLAKEGGQDRFRAITGLPLATYFSRPKIAWMLENVPGFKQDAIAGKAIFGTMK